MLAAKRPEASRAINLSKLMFALLATACLTAYTAGNAIAQESTTEHAEVQGHDEDHQHAEDHDSHAGHAQDEQGHDEHGEHAGHGEHDHEWSVLFDGSSLEHFRGYQSDEVSDGWKIENEVLKFDASARGDLMTKGEYDNFELRFEWMVTEGANSGVMYRVSTGDRAPYLSGPEFQILDDANHHDGENEMTSAGSLYAMYPPTGKTMQAVGEWNTARILCDGNRIEHWLNGTMVVEAEIGSEQWTEKLNNSKFKDWEKFAKNDGGHICFQDHGNVVFFRNIMVRNIVHEDGHADHGHADHEEHGEHEAGGEHAEMHGEGGEHAEHEEHAGGGEHGSEGGGHGG